MHHLPCFCMPGPHAYCTRTPSIRPVWIGVRQLAVQLVWVGKSLAGRWAASVADSWALPIVARRPPRRSIGAPPKGGDAEVPQRDLEFLKRPAPAVKHRTRQAWKAARPEKTGTARSMMIRPRAALAMRRRIGSGVCLRRGGRKTVRCGGAKAGGSLAAMRG
jgi:hypothetical protein